MSLEIVVYIFQMVWNYERRVMKYERMRKIFEPITFLVSKVIASISFALSPFAVECDWKCCSPFQVWPS